MSNCESGVNELNERNLKSDDSCISNPKSQIGRGADNALTVQFEMSDFEFEIQELFDFEISFDGLRPRLRSAAALRLEATSAR